MNLLSHFLTRPPEVRRFEPVAPMVQPSWVERALDRAPDRKLIAGWIGGCVVTILIVGSLYGGLFL